jgi:4-oxalocrotonate tautomerase
MPMITVAYATTRSEARLKAAVAQAASDLAAQILHKDPKVTAVKVQAVDSADWFCAGHSLAQSGLAAFWLDARADSYGFSGVTQERRYVAGKLGTKLSAAA